MVIGTAWKVGDMVVLKPEYHRLQREGMHPAPSTDILKVVRAGYTHSSISRQTVRFETGGWCWSDNFELAGGPW